MMYLKKIGLPLAIIVIAIVSYNVILANPPKSDRSRPSQNPQMTVETKLLSGKSYQVYLESFGTVKPRTGSALVAQVSGQIMYVSPQFREGGFFEKGDLLVKLDDRDYKADVKIAEASLISARQGLLEEQARSNQALIDWKRLGNDKAASSLVLREPHLEAAKAQVLSAEAKLAQAELSLERSKIVAPYAGRILNKFVDVGQVVSGNTQLADIYATDYVEVRLPIKNKDLNLIALPEEYRDKSAITPENSVTFESDLVGNQVWQGNIQRTEGAIDGDSQQLYIVASIDNPFVMSADGTAPIKIGQYVSAKLSGKKLTDAIVIPNSSIYQGSYVYVVENQVLVRKDIRIRWQNQTEAIIATGLSSGDKLVLTPLGQVSSGTPVAVAGEAKPKRNTAGKPKGPKKDRGNS